MANLSIKSRLLVMLLGVSAISIAIVASLSYYASYNALRDSVFKQLTSLRAIKAQAVETYFNALELEAAGIAEGPAAQQAAAELIQAYHGLKDIGENPEWDAQLETYYSEEFIPKLSKRVEGTPTVAAHLPNTPVGRYLQTRYIATNRFPVKAKQQLTEIPDDNAYARAHARHHLLFRRLVEKLGYYDLFIIDIETGDIVYSVAKEVDFATNLIDGPYDTSNLAELFRSIQRTPDQGVVRMVDYARYRPSNSRSQAFVATPIFVQGKAVAVLALQISNKEINQVMTGGGHWERDGLSKTGETILVGEHNLMRSHSRFLIENPETYAAEMRAFRLDEAAIARMLEFESSTLIQPVRTLASNEALQGRTGTGVAALADLEQSQLRQLAEDADRLWFGAGETVVQQGEMSAAVYVIDAGRAHTLYQGAAAESREILSLGEGELFDETALTHGQPNAVSIVADTDLEVLRIPLTSLESLLEIHPQTAHQFANLIDLRNNALQRIIAARV